MTCQSCKKGGKKKWTMKVYKAKEAVQGQKVPVAHTVGAVKGALSSELKQEGQAAVKTFKLQKGLHRARDPFLNGSKRKVLNKVKAKEMLNY